jgi:hypothetical protein
MECSMAQPVTPPRRTAPPLSYVARDNHKILLDIRLADGSASADARDHACVSGSTTSSHVNALVDET